MTRIHGDRLVEHMLGSLLYSGIESRGQAQAIDDALENYRRLGALGHNHLPFHLVLDFSLILQLGFEVEFASDSAIDHHLAADHELRSLRLRYERECLGRLLQTREVTDAIELANSSPQPGAHRQHLLTQLIRHFAPHYPQVTHFNPAELRGLTLPEISPAEIDPHHAPSPNDLDRFLDEVSEHVRWATLLRQEDFFELRHLELLDSDHLRLGCRQTLELDRRLCSRQPLALDLSKHEDQADTAFLDETHYPTGGFAGLTNRGSFENLVLSELVYLDEGTADCSLFELRYVESELLFYMRDAGNLRRKRRTIHFIIDLGEQFTHKSFGYDYQYAVLANGLCIRLMNDLLKLFELDALRFEFHYLPVGDRATLHAEMRVAEVILADHIRHGWVSLSAPDTLKLESLIDPRRKSYAIVLASTTQATRWHTEKQRIADEEIPLHLSMLSFGTGSASEGELPAEGMPTDQITLCKEALIRHLMQ